MTEAELVEIVEAVQKAMLGDRHATRAVIDLHATMLIAEIRRLQRELEQARR